MEIDKNQITHLLQQWQEGDSNALKSLLPLVYQALRRRAAQQLQHEKGGVLTPTELVHELYFKLVDQRRAQFQNRSHFFYLAAQLMRRLLVDHCRANKRVKRGGAQPTIQLSDDMIGSGTTTLDFEALNTALDQLEQIDKRMCEVVQLKFFAGLSQEETAAVLKVSVPTVQRDWRAARLWLFRYLSEDQVKMGGLHGG